MIIGVDASRANRIHKTGTEWYSYYLIRWLAKLDNKNEYILYSDKPLKGGLLDLSTEEYHIQQKEDLEIKYDKKGFQIIKSPYNNFKVKVLKWPFRYFWTLGRLSIEMIFKKPDILFVPSHTLPIFLPKKSIATIHDVGFCKKENLYEKLPMKIEGKIRCWFLNFLVKIATMGKYSANSFDYLNWATEYTLKKANKIITVSEFSKQEIIKYYKIYSEKIRVVYNGYNKYLYKEISDPEKIKSVLRRYEINESYLFYVGRIEKKKNIPSLIEAFAQMRVNNKDIKHKLVLAGFASYGYDETNYMIKEFRLDNEVIILGWVPEEDLPYLFNGASAFVFPSNYEGFGIPLLQAMACGVPIACSRSASIPEIVGNAALYFESDNTQSIANILEKIITDKEVRLELKQFGLERVKYFSWQKSAELTLKEILKC
jgi:glycosyltransferase involved in cell wall biosynthesis